MKLSILILISTFFFILAASGQSISFADLETKWITKDTRANFGEVNALYEDSLGVIWIGIFGKGLSYFDGKDFYRVSMPDEEVFASHAKCFVKHKNRLYLNSNNYLSVFDPIARKVEAKISFETDAGQQINELCFIEKNGVLNIYTLVPINTTENEISYQIYVSENYTPFRLLRSENFTTRGPIMAKSISDHQLLLKGTSELIVFDPFTFEEDKLELKNSDIEYITSNSIAVDKRDRLWLLSKCNGRKLFRRCTALEMISLANRTDDQEIEIDLGIEQNIQVAIDTLGDYILLPNIAININDFSTQVGLPTRLQPGSILTRSGIIFNGSVVGLDQFQSHQSAFKKIGPIAGRSMIELPDGAIMGTVAYDPTDILTSIYIPEKDSVYTSDIVSISKGNTYQFALHENDIYTKSFKKNINNGQRVNFDQIQEDFKSSPLLSLIDSKGRQWKASWYHPLVGLYSETGERINKVHIKALENTKVELNDWYERLSDNSIWLGSSGLGIFIFSEDGNLLHHLNRREDSKVRLNNNHVSGFYEDVHQNIWIAHGAGISKISADLSGIEHFMLNENNPESHIFYSILPDDDEDFLWLSSSQGVFQFDMRSERFKGFPLDKDIMSYEYNRTSFLKTKTGEIYYGTSHVNKPTVRFMPSEVTQSYKNMAADNSSYISIQSCQVNYKNGRSPETIEDINKITKIVFDKDLSSYEFKFFLTNYSATDEIYYSHKLENHDSEWSTLKKGNNTVQHKNLDPGKYTLRLRAGLFQETEYLAEKSIPLVVLPYWFQTWWSKILYLLIFASLLYLIYKYNIKRQFNKQENRRLKDLDQLKTKLYTNITHEFRTPLSVILGMTDSIASHPKETSLINRNARSLLQLIDQLLDLSKLDSGKIEVEMIYSDLVAYVKYLVESFFSMATGKRIRLSFESASEEMFLHFDEHKMQHIIYNLLSNAIKFTKPGGKILASLDFQDSAILLSVKDTGIGIPDKDKPYLFDRYYQVKHKKESTKNYIAGTGLGLAFTKELIDLMGGSIKVSSRVNWGSEFIVRIPSSDQPKMNSQFKINNETATLIDSIPVTSDQLDDQKPNVLLIEDNDGVAQYIKTLLKEDYYLQWAINGQEGIDLAIQQIPDIIITDVMMPEKNGFEVTDILKNDDRTSHIPIIVLTAKADMKSKLEGLEKGADAYLAKPFQKKELMVRIKKLLELRSQLQKHYSIAESLDENKAPIKEPTKEDLFLSKIHDIIDTNKQNSDLPIQFIAREMTMSYVQLYRKLKALTGITPVSYIRKYRLQVAMNLLRTTDMNVSEIAYEVGFNDPNYFSRVFKTEFGNSPLDYRK